MKETVYLVEATVYDPAISDTRVLRYATGCGYVIDGYYYEPRLKDPGQFKVNLFSSGKTSGPSQVGYGEIRLVNNDGGLDTLLNYGFDGRPLVIKKAVMLGTTVISNTTLLTCSAEQATCDWTGVSIRIKDGQQAFNVPLQPNKYGGTNELPSGLDGSDDIKGRPKPMLYGVCKNITPVCVNTARLIYQVNDGAVADVPAVYDKGITLQAGADYTSQAQMESTAPTPGEFRAWPAGGYFRLGASPAGQVTADAIEVDVPGYASNTAANVMVRIAYGVASRSSLANPTISADDISALNAANGAEVGYYAAAETTEAAALDAVAASIGAWYGFDSSGTLRFGRLEEPAGAPVATLTKNEVKSVERLASNDSGRGLPAWRVSLTYDRNWSPAASGWGDSFALSASTYPPEIAHTLLAYGNGVAVAMGIGDEYWTSTDKGQTWTASYIPPITDDNDSWGALGYGNGKFVLLMNTAPCALTSTDGHWSSNWHQLPTNGDWFGVAYGNGTWIAVSRLSGAMTSPDGVTWTSQTFGSVNDSGDFKFGGGVFVAALGPDVYTSTTGVSWAQRTMPTPTNYVHVPEACLWPRLAYGDGTWVAIGGRNQIAVSTDNAASWAAVGFLPTTVYSLTYSNGHFIGAGNSKIVYSPDGFSWRTLMGPQAFGAGGQIVAEDGVVIVSGDSGAVFSPTDRSTWLTLDSRTLSAENATVKTKHPLAIERSVDTLLANEDDAQNEADRLLDLYGADRDLLRIKVQRDALPADILGKVILLGLPRYGLQEGKLMVVVGTEDDFGTPNIILDVWG